jgi:hypothetical protein
MTKYLIFSCACCFAIASQISTVFAKRNCPLEYSDDRRTCDTYQKSEDYINCYNQIQAKNADCYKENNAADITYECSKLPAVAKTEKDHPECFKN